MVKNFPSENAAGVKLCRLAARVPDMPAGWTSPQTISDRTRLLDESPGFFARLISNREPITKTVYF